ncbi:MAG: MerR family transcriptional regulator [Gemmatimonadaceae bacterium]|nr:MerR family transcriptional regulator [Gloeobacterales cyanobacterium ES-bin-141]
MMSQANSYRIQQFAELAGVTVRTLHHYDRLNLLCPTRTEIGYRLYTDHDLERLEQIVALKFLGLSLKQIKAVLDRDARELPEILRSQRRALEEKRRQLERAIGAIRDAEGTIQPGEPADANVLRKIIEVIEMQEDTDYMKKYYSDEAWATLTERREMGPQSQEQVSQAWVELFRDVEDCLGEDPAAPRVQALAVRWKALVAEFTGGDTQLAAGLKSAWADREHWPESHQKYSGPFTDQRVWDFISRAMNCAGQ